MNLSDIAYTFAALISKISKSDAINLMQNINLTEKADHHKTYQL